MKKTTHNKSKTPKSRPTANRAGYQRIGPGSLLRFTLSFLVWGTVVLAALVGWYAYDLPDVEKLEETAGRRAPTVSLLAADGSTLSHYGELYGVAVQLHQLPPHLPHAVLAVEDRRFYLHSGVDPLGIVRAVWTNLWAGGIRSGGSTITQQLAKNLFLSPDRTIRRKVQELLLALWLEQRYSKDQILTIYLNRVYFGAGAYGVDAAARRYFDKPASRLSVYESALLAGLLKAPSRYNPLVDPKAAAERADVVLRAMIESGWLGARQADAARTGRAVVRGDGAGAQIRYFADWAMDRARDYIGYDSGDLVIETTIDPRLQRLAERTLSGMLEKAAPRKVGQGALVAMRPDGAVVAMVGGRSYAETQFNRATQALRQPGSAFKLFVYLAAIESGIRPGDEVVDAPVSIGDWTPQNAGGKHRGAVTVREAAARSLNSIAVTLAERVGRDRVVEVARRLGITSELRPDPSLALGAYEVSLLELTAAYGTIANRGMGVWPYGITAIRDAAGRVLYSRTGGGPGRVVEEENVAAINDIFTAAITWGTGKAARLDRPAAGKTGTSQDNRDAWFVGYTPDLVAGVWFGNDDNSPMDRIGGGSYPALTWKAFMKPALEGVDPKPLPGVVARAAD